MAEETLIPLVYEQLRALAARYMAGERGEHTLRPTALVHEAWLRMAQSGTEWKDRVHFQAVAAGVMRNILVDHARSRARQKRGEGGVRLSLDDAEPMLVSQESTDAPLLEQIDDALKRLEEFDERKARIIVLIYFGGMTQDEAAIAVGVSEPTIQRELRLAKAWLRNELSNR